MKALNRELGFDSYEFPQTPSLIIRQTKKGPELIPVELSVLCGMDAKRYLDGG